MYYHNLNDSACNILQLHSNFRLKTDMPCLKPHLWKMWKWTNFKANVLWKTDRKKDPHKTIYSWQKHSWLKPRQSYETEIRWVEKWMEKHLHKNISIISVLDQDVFLWPHLQKQTLLNHSWAQSPISCRRLELAQFTLICDKDTSALFTVNHLEMNDPIRLSIPQIQTPHIY